MMDLDKIQEELAQPVTELTLPLPHILIRLIRANITYFLASRGSFKTSRGIALYIIDMVYLMPRSSGCIVGLSFEHLGDNTLPPLLNAFASFGFVQDEHYVVGVRPPEHFEAPYLSVYKNKYDHTITFQNGTTIHLISLAKKASANGISAQWGVFDEAKFMDEKVLVDEIFPIFRGNEIFFQHSEGYLSKFFATDKLADPVHIKWLLKKRSLNDPKKNEVIITLAVALNDLRAEYYTAGINRKAELQAEIDELQQLLSSLRMNLVYYVESTGYDTEKIMGKKWLRDKKLNMTEYEYNVAILNKDPDRPGVGFYPDFVEGVHCYQDDDDIDLNKPWIMGADYQHSVSPIVTAQIGEWQGRPALLYKDAVHTLAPEGLTEAVQKWSDRHHAHRKRVVYYVFDQTAVGKRNDADSFYNIVINALKKNGWHVVPVYTSAAPFHFQKYTDTQNWLQEKDEKAMLIRINTLRCDKMRISIMSAGAKTSRGKTEKDKSAEQEARLDQSETTHFSDVFDMINHAVLKLKRIKLGEGSGAGVSMR